MLGFNEVMAEFALKNVVVDAAATWELWSP